MAEQTTGSMTNVGCTHLCGGLRCGEGTEGDASRSDERDEDKEGRVLRKKYDIKRVGVRYRKF